MNMTDPKWFANLELDGKAVESWGEKSLSAIITQLAHALAQLQSSGAPKREILLRINPHAQYVANQQAQQAGNPLEESIKGEAGMMPLHGESASAFYERLRANDYPEPIANQFTCDWFPEDFGQRLTAEAMQAVDAWMEDAKVMRWSQLHLNREAYAKALPGEYQELRRYIESEYPERAEQIKWRTE